MLTNLFVKTFKSLDDVAVDLGLVNVFIGANGSGKTNLLEALGILSAAANGKVDDVSLLNRGVRTGVPALYKSAFPAPPRGRIPPHLRFGATGSDAKYEVSLHNPLNDPAPAWRYKTELWSDGNESLVARIPAHPDKTNPERGLAALTAVRVSSGGALDLLTLLQGYVIFSPTTSVLRGIVPEMQPKTPVGTVRREPPKRNSGSASPKFQESTQSKDLPGRVGTCRLGEKLRFGPRRDNGVVSDCSGFETGNPISRSVYA